MKNEIVKKILYFLIVMVIYAGIYLLGYGCIALLQKLIVIHPYIQLCLYLVLFPVDIFITTKIVSMHKILNWLNQF